MANTFPNRDWNLSSDDGNIPSWDHVAIAVLMDIRRELMQLNALLGCQNFIAIPHTLRDIRTSAFAIDRNTHRPRRKRKTNRLRSSAKADGR